MKRGGLVIGNSMRSLNKGHIVQQLSLVILLQLHLLDLFFPHQRDVTFVPLLEERLERIQIRRL